MKTVSQILDEAQKNGIPCTERTFWKYHKLGLLPEGQKLPGRGNVAYFPDDTLLRLWLIAFLKSEMNLNLSDFSRYEWPEIESDPEKLPNEWSGDFFLNAKRQCQKAKREAMRTVIEQLVEGLRKEDKL